MKISGNIFKNTKKTAEKQPDYRGDGKDGEVEYWISGWKKTDRNGSAYLSLAIEPKETKAPETPETPDSADSDLPF